MHENDFKEAEAVRYLEYKLSSFNRRFLTNIKTRDKEPFFDGIIEFFEEFDTEREKSEKIGEFLVQVKYFSSEKNKYPIKNSFIMAAKKEIFRPVLLFLVNVEKGAIYCIDFSDEYINSLLEGKSNLPEKSKKTITFSEEDNIENTNFVKKLEKIQQERRLLFGYPKKDPNAPFYKAINKKVIDIIENDFQGIQNILIREGMELYLNVFPNENETNSEDEESDSFVFEFGLRDDTTTTPLIQYKNITDELKNIRFEVNNVSFNPKNKVEIEYISWLFIKSYILSKINLFDFPYLKEPSFQREYIYNCVLTNRLIDSGLDGKELINEIEAELNELLEQVNSEKSKSGKTSDSLEDNIKNLKDRLYYYNNILEVGHLFYCINSLKENNNHFSVKDKSLRLVDGNILSKDFILNLNESYSSFVEKYFPIQKDDLLLIEEGTDVFLNLTNMESFYIQSGEGKVYCIDSNEDFQRILEEENPYNYNVDFLKINDIIYRFRYKHRNEISMHTPLHIPFLFEISNYFLRENLERLLQKKMLELRPKKLNLL